MSDKEEDIGEAERISSTPIRILLAIQGERQRHTHECMHKLMSKLDLYIEQHDERHDKIDSDMDGLGGKISGVWSKVKMIFMIPAVVAATATVIVGAYYFVKEFSAR